MLDSAHSSLLSLINISFAMSKKKSPQEYLQRAREKGSENNKDIVDGTEVKKKL